MLRRALNDTDILEAGDADTRARSAESAILPRWIGRFELLRPLGRGGDGLVYAVRDSRSGTELALKELRYPGPDAVFRLKREFRVLAALRHPSLVRLGELQELAGRFCFTMELVDGAPFGEWMQAGERERGQRIAHAFDALTSALIALHDFGYAHCDIKPENIRVTAAGRVVLLDLGLATPLRRAFRALRDAASRAGTPHYMAPEQAAGGTVTSATDAYALGVILFQTLTGRLPFEGPVASVLRDRQVLEAEWPRGVDAPADLKRLCLRLLRIDPEARPTLEEMRAVLGLGRVVRRSSFAGRIDELDALRRHDAARGVGFRAVLVEGDSGIGKTSLIETFLGARDDVVVLRSRCFERESVAFNALDGVVDGLSRVLEGTNVHTSISALEPEERRALLRQFPVLSVDLPAAEGNSEPPLDPLRVRFSAVDALRKVLSALARQFPVHIFLDDVHWADADSVSALTTLFAAPDAPAVLLLCATRPIGRKLCRSFSGDWGEVANLTLGGLAEEDALRMAEDVGLTPAQAATLVDDCAGHPFFLRACLAGQSERLHADARPRTLDDVLRERLDQASIDERCVLSLLAITDRPIERRVLEAACGLPHTQFSAAIENLAERLLCRSSGPGEHDTVESYHDKTAAAVLSIVPEAAQRAGHRMLADALDHAGASPEALVRHLLAIGERARAFGKALAAARSAQHTFAFARAAELFACALDLVEPGSEKHVGVAVELAEARSQAGLPRLAAEAYLLAEKHGPTDLKFSFRRAAAEQLLYSGALREGLQVLRADLSALGIDVEPPRTRMFATLAFRRAWLQIRGLGWAKETIVQRDLRRVDVLWTLARVLSFVDTPLAAALHSAGLQGALDAGEPVRVARALGLELGFLAVSGGYGSRRYARVEEAARDAARMAGSREASAVVDGGTALASFVTGRWAIAARELDDVARRLEALRVVSWERRTAEFAALYAHDLCGNVPLVRKRLPRLLREAEESQDVQFATNLRVSIVASICLYDDTRSGGVGAIDEALTSWPHSLSVQHYYAFVAKVRVLLYEGQADAALGFIEGERPRLESAYLVAGPGSKLEAELVTGLALLASSLSPKEREKRLASVLVRLAAVPSPATRAFQSLLVAGDASSKNEMNRARMAYADAARGFADLRMRLHEAVTLIRVAELDARPAEVASQCDTLRTLTIRNPYRLVEMLAPTGVVQHGAIEPLLPTPSG